MVEVSGVSVSGLSVSGVFQGFQWGQQLGWRRPGGQEKKNWALQVETSVRRLQNLVCSSWISWAASESSGPERDLDGGQVV